MISENYYLFSNSFLNLVHHWVGMGSGVIKNEVFYIFVLLHFFQFYFLPFFFLSIIGWRKSFDELLLKIKIKYGQLYCN